MYYQLPAGVVWQKHQVLNVMDTRSACADLIMRCILSLAQPCSAAVWSECQHECILDQPEGWLHLSRPSVEQMHFAEPTLLCAQHIQHTLDTCHRWDGHPVHRQARNLQVSMRHDQLSLPPMGQSWFFAPHMIRPVLTCRKFGAPSSSGNSFLFWHPEQVRCMVNARWHNVLLSRGKTSQSHLRSRGLLSPTRP